MSFTQSLNQDTRAFLVWLKGSAGRLVSWAGEGEGNVKGSEEGLGGSLRAQAQSQVSDSGPGSP